MKKHVYKKTSIERVHPEGRKLSFDISDKISSLNIDGVYLVKEAKRTYPYNISFATACIQSYDDKNTLMIMMRESKIALLKFEISSLKK